MSLTVVDASVLTAVYGTDDPRRADALAVLERGDALYAPAHLDVEVLSALRGIARHRTEVATVIPRALGHLMNAPIRRMPIAPLLARSWELRDNVTPYDAAYVALAEQLGATLVTCDAKMAGATGPRCNFEVVT